MNHRTAKDSFNRLDSHTKANNPIPECRKQMGMVDAFVQIMADNGLDDYDQLHHLYKRYKPESKGCNVDDPIVITTVDYDYVRMERNIIEYIFMTCEHDRHKFMRQALVHKEDRWLDCLTYAVLDKDGGVFGKASYWFDVTLGIQATQEMLKQN